MKNKKKRKYMGIEKNVHKSPSKKVWNGMEFTAG